MYRVLASIAIVLITVLSAANIALACGCDSECPPGETYSDEAEMCVEDQLS